MSERSEIPRPEGEYFERNRFGGLSILLALVAFVALVLSVVGAVVDTHQFAFSWLFAFAFFFTLCAGCFFWTIVHHATDAEWSVVVRRQLENIATLLAVMAIFLIPVLVLRHHLYEWMNIPPGHEASLDTKAALSQLEFLPRARRLLLRLLHHRLAIAPPLFRAAGQGRQSAFHPEDAESFRSLVCRSSRSVSPSARAIG